MGLVYQEKGSFFKLAVLVHRDIVTNMEPSFYELKRLFALNQTSGAVFEMDELIKTYINQDQNTELFSGEHVSQILAAKENNMSSAYFMAFNQEDEQELHYHTGSRILFIFTKKNASAHLGTSSDSLKEEKMEDGSMYVLRMNAEVFHQFAGDFVAISIHPKDTKIRANMNDETRFS